jgi:hypothetical protein
VRGGADSLLVLTGVVAAGELAAAPPGSRPTYVAADLRGLLEAHPDVEVDGEVARCGRAIAAYEDEVVRMRPGPDPSGNALRAAVTLCWAYADRGLPASLG